MSQHELNLYMKHAASLIEFIGTVGLFGFLIRGLIQVFRNWRIPEMAQLVAADGIIFVLDFKLAATILKTFVLNSWHQIGSFVLILAIRLVIKHQMAWQEDLLRARSSDNVRSRA